MSRTFFEQGRAQNRIDPHTRQMIALVLRLHRSLSALVGDDTALMRHWINTANRHTGGIPQQQLQAPEQLVELVQYLDAIHLSASPTALMSRPFWRSFSKTASLNYLLHKSAICGIGCLVS